MVQALILAGGRGTRLRPLTDLYPKPLLYLPGGTLLDHLLNQLERLAITDIAIVVNYKADAIARHIRKRRHIRLIQQKGPATFMAALASAADWVQGPTLVLHGDNYFGQWLEPYVRRATPGRNTFFVSQDAAFGDTAARMAQTGAYILQPEIFRWARMLVEHDSLQALTYEIVARNAPMQILPTNICRFNVNEPSDLLHITHLMLRDWSSMVHPPYANLLYDPMMLSWKARDAVVEESSLGLYVTIGHGAHVRRSRLRHALVFPHTHVEDEEEEFVILAESRRVRIQMYVPMPHLMMPVAVAP
ncbi:MAG: hypothetical protein D6802_11770 [Ardenticatenia bacterium]|uniref:Nucleotidyl transferase domain-containing protein n=1 Tax=Ardenticatena maritima TaxID=872965 RepID=A0A0M8K896_9CHLR|nr:hypothetical protein SE16_00545 [Ardenticatena maritima]RME09530.1 MAG: hypothetical protein D6802_11770 [Ardenticatenia bacterium]GAP63795.1 hypothetical protein ARMA_2218 [Ardenticatena maritima]